MEAHQGENTTKSVEAKGFTADKNNELKILCQELCRKKKLEKKKRGN